MKVSLIGGGAWGTTLAQVLSDNDHETLVYDINNNIIESINKHSHPFFEGIIIPSSIKATSKIEEAIRYSNYIVLCVPTKVIRNVLKQINKYSKEEKVYINVSKGIEPGTSKMVSEIVDEEITKKKGFVVLTGPSHAEEVILRKLTTLVSASDDNNLAIEVQKLFANDKYLRIYTSNDLIGCQIGGAIKNAIAVVSGMADGVGLGENARAALISRGILEIIRVVEVMGGNKETAFGLTGIGDLIVTASSENSRNFRAGKKIGSGEKASDVVNNSTQTVEGVRTIKAAYEIGKNHNIELPIINMAYAIIYENVDISEGIPMLLSRTLKAE